MVMEVKVNENIEKIMEKNLHEKSETISVTIDCCKKCRFYDDPWVRGDTLHCCSHNSDMIKTSRGVNELYANCPISHKTELTQTYIKQYGIIHRKPEEDSYYYDKCGSISIVDFSDTTFEDDGYNPDVEWKNVAVFFYDTQEECDKMMELALEFYNRFNLDAPYVKKRCFG